MEPVSQSLRDSDLWNRAWWSWRSNAKAPEREAFIRHLLRTYESQNVTYMERDGSWPIIWKRAKGVYVWDESGKKYLDLTAAFGVAATGHSNSDVVAAGIDQMKKLLHAMGDVHPHPLKALLARKLSDLTFGQWMYRYCDIIGVPFGPKWHGSGKVIFCNSGFEAVEAALKTALLATGKTRVIAFEGGYHGLGYGSLNATHRSHFRSPFRKQLSEFADFVPFPTRQQDLGVVEGKLRKLLRKKKSGAILVEPIQGRAGIRVPPDGFLWMLRRLANETGVILIYDEVLTGFGRTGNWFACEYEGAPPDIICLGKALTGGFPLSACVGLADLMDNAWPPSTGEALHTSTFLGHPVGCAMALAQIELLTGIFRWTSYDWMSNTRRLGHVFIELLERIPAPAGFRLSVRGRGLMIGFEIQDKEGRPATAFTLHVIKEMLRLGFILLPEGEHGNVIAFTPPLTIRERALRHMVAVLRRVINKAAKQ